MKRNAKYLAILCATVFSVSAVADDYSDASLALCEKVKSCALAQMDSQEVTPEVRQMMQPMLDSMCTSMLASVPEVAKSHAMYEPAVACMKSLDALSCEEMQGDGGSKTAACMEYEKMAEKYDSP